MDDVGRDDLEVDDLVHGNDELVDRDLAARVPVEPVVLVPLDRDLEAAGRPAAGASSISGSFTKTNATMIASSSHRHDRPRHLDPRVSSHLRALALARAVSAAVADEEDDERRLDDDEHEARHEEDEDVRVVDRLRVLRRRLHRRQAAVVPVRRPRREQDAEERRQGRSARIDVIL